MILGAAPLRRLAALLPLLLAACADSAPRIPQMACPTLPAKPAATHPLPLPPISDKTLVLQPGHWDWVDGTYVWESAAWVLPPHGGQAIWLDGFWTPNGGGCAWTQGHFLP